MNLSDEKRDFFNDVYEVVKLIPPGRVTSYGAIAVYLGAKRSARVVGWALNGVKSLEEIPAQRVVNRVGLLSGKFHFNGVNKMQELLELEGIEVKENKIVNFEQHFWNPSTELTL